MKYLKIANERKFDFKGRSSRSEFWWFVVHYIWINICLNLAGYSLIFVADIIQQDWFNISVLLIMIVHIVISLYLAFMQLSCAIRRVHDCGRSGWWSIVPVISLIFLCMPSEQGANKYGSPSTY